MFRSNPLALAACALCALVAAPLASAQTPDQQKQRQEREERQQQRMNLQAASKLIGLRVNSEDGQRVGTIQNMAILPQRGDIVYLIVNTDGSPEKLTAVPYQAVRFSGQDQAIQLNINKARFQDAPTFDPAGWDTIGDRRWGQTIHEFYSITPRFQRLQTDEGQPLNLVRLSNVLKMNVENRRGENLGQVEDLAVDVRRGTVVLAAVTPKQRFEMDDKYVLVAWPALDIDRRERELDIKLSSDRFEGAPTVERDQWPTVNQQTLNQTFAFFGVDPSQVYGYTPPDSDRPNSPGQPDANTGWESQSQYNQRFDAGDMTTVNGRVQSIERFTPMNGMSEGIRLVLRTEGKETETIHLGPAWFLSRQESMLKEGDQVRVNGSKVEIGGDEVIMAIDVRSGDQVLVLRHRNGAPIWDAWLSVNEIQRLGRDRDDMPGRGLGRDRNPKNDNDD